MKNFELDTLEGRMALVLESMREVSAELREITEDKDMEAQEWWRRCKDTSERLGNLQTCLNMLILELLERKVA
jgi:hypothetical protein